MQSAQPVLITGIGAVTGTGQTAEAGYQALMSGQQALKELQTWDLSSWTHRLGAELEQYQPATLLPDRKLTKVISRQDVLGIAAGTQAMTQSQLPDYFQQLPEAEQIGFAEDSAVFVGSPGNKFFQQYDFLPLLAKSRGDMHVFAEHLFSEVHPMWLLRILPNNVLAYLGIHYGWKGVNHNITNHAVSGMQALLEAYQAIASGQASRAIVVGYDVGTDTQAMYYYAKLGLLSERDLKPFDAKHDGTILAEGAAALVLESADAVHARGGKALAEVVGGGSATEAQGLFGIDPEGLSLKHLMASTLAQCDISAADLGMLVAHGNGSYHSDCSEAKAIQAVCSSTPVTAFKWSMGHTLCASGLLDVVLGLQAMQARCIPGIANLTAVADECAGLNLSASHRSWEPNAQHMMILNRGFGSMNAAVVLREYR